MNNDWQGQFAQGFVATGSDSGAIWVVLFVLFALVGVGVLYNQMNKAPRRSRTVHRADREEVPRPTKVPVPPPVLGKLHPVVTKVNPLQQRILHELIDEFRQQETSAQSVPVAVLEKYSEFFFENVKRMKTNEADVREFVNMHYPIREGYGVEMDFQASGVMHLIKSRVLEVGAKTITVAFDGQVLAFMKRGNDLLLNYNVGKHFLQGATLIAEVKPHVGIVVRKPQHISLTSERRYSRVNLRNVFGTLQDPKRAYKTSVRVMDLSLEGVRIQVEKPLEKRNIHQVTFDVTMDSKPLSFGPIECVPSKAFLTGTGTYESGLVFLYLDIATKQKLTAYMKYLAQELQDARAAAGN
jgi:hypothetical protein